MLIGLLNVRIFMKKKWFIICFPLILLYYGIQKIMIRNVGVWAPCWKPAFWQPGRTLLKAISSTKKKTQAETSHRRPSLLTYERIDWATPQQGAWENFGLFTQDHEEKESTQLAYWKRRKRNASIDDLYVSLQAYMSSRLPTVLIDWRGKAVSGQMWLHKIIKCIK